MCGVNAPATVGSRVTAHHGANRDGACGAKNATNALVSVLHRCTSTAAWRRRSTSRASARWSPSTAARRPRSAQQLSVASACSPPARGDRCGGIKRARPDQFIVGSGSLTPACRYSGANFATVHRSIMPAERLLFVHTLLSVSRVFRVASSSWAFFPEVLHAPLIHVPSVRSPAFVKRFSTCRRKTSPLVYIYMYTHTYMYTNIPYTYNTQDNTPPGLIFKAQVLEQREE